MGEALKYKLTFPREVLQEPLMHALGKKFDVIPSIVKGVITAEEAWMEVLFAGERAEIDRALEYMKKQNIDVSFLGQSVPESDD